MADASVPDAGALAPEDVTGHAADEAPALDYPDELPSEANEADVVEQAQAVPFDDDRR